MKERPKWWPVGPIVTGLVVGTGFPAWGLTALFSLHPFGAGFVGDDPFFNADATHAVRIVAIMLTVAMPFAFALLAFDIYSTDVWPRWLRTSPTALDTKNRPRLRKCRKWVFAVIFVIAVAAISVWSIASAATTIRSPIGAFAAAVFAGAGFLAVVGVLVFVGRWLAGAAPMSPRDARWSGTAAVPRAADPAN